jgi:hypothetical protein
MQVRDVPERRGSGAWVPVALVLLLLGLAICGLAATQGRNILGTLPGFLPAAATAGPTATPTPGPSPTVKLGGVVIASPGPVTPVPPATNAPALAPTNTPPPAPTNTPAPAPTNTPNAAPPPTSPPATPVPSTGNNTVSLTPDNFSGGYRRTDGMYHGIPATWVYGQGTSYSTMSASFDVSGQPGAGSLTIVGVDSEDPPKTPIQISVNGTTIYQGPDPLPNDTTAGPNGPGNWGTYTWSIPQGTLRQGTNQVTITNLDPSDKINYPIFFMLNSVTINW